MAGSRVSPLSHPSRSRHSSRHSVSYLPAPQVPESLIFSDNITGLDITAQEQDTENVILEADIDHRRRLPWWKRPSALWLLIMIPFIMAATAMTVAPRIEIVTQLVCRTLRPSTGADFVFYSNEDNPDFKLCSSDPVVQAAAAKFLTVMTTMAGVLSCFTTAAWASRSDRKGRVSTMRLCTFGLLATDAVYIYVYHVIGRVPGGYWYLLIGPVIEGFFGGMSASSANIHAYIADCTEPAKRSRIFSLYLGLFCIGIAIGPTLGSITIRYTQEVIFVFYIASVIHLLYILTLWFVVPESLYPRQISRASRAYKALTSTAGFFTFGRLFSFMAPLRVLIPVRASHKHSLKKRLDWNLTLLAVAFGLANMMINSYPYKFQYASLMFGWTSEILGYYMSILGFTRAVYLTIILPTLIALFKRKPKQPVKSYTEPSETSYSPASSSTYDAAPPAQSEIEPLQSLAGSTDLGHDHHHNSPALDLNIARASLIVEIAAYILMSTATTGPLFTVFTVMTSFGAGLTPAVESLALAVYTSRGGTESGSLFGALSVMNALCGQLLSPVLFGSTYAATVGTFPQTIFVLCAAVLSCSLVLVSLVRIPKLRYTAVERNENEEFTSIDPASKADDDDDMVGEE